MRKILYMMIMLMTSLKLLSQDIYQQTHLVFDEELSPQQSYVCQATSSIMLKPGFCYMPSKDDSMRMRIDRYSVFPPAEGSCGSEMVDGAVVGTLKGTFDISNTGAAVYSINIGVPDALGAMKPDLSIVYNSQSSNGTIGWAWELSGISVITRVGQTEYHDGTITDVDFVHDRFLLDGQRLMIVDGSTYGANNVEYKTEIDNMTKIKSYANVNSNDPQYFVVWKSDGTIWEYGTTEDSKLEVYDDGDKIIRWSVSRIRDRNGNAINYYYDKNVVTGEMYINNIQYTSNHEAGVSPAYKVLFEYDTKESDWFVGYVGGNKVSNSMLLRNIEIVNNTTGNKLMEYSLEYFEPGMFDDDYFMHYRLKSVGLTVGDDEINPTRIIWNAKKNHYPSNNYDCQIFQLDETVFCSVPFVGDFNGDGLSDVLTVPYKIQDMYPDEVEGKVYLNDGDGSFQTKPIATIRLAKNLEWVYVFDFNGDGKDDIITLEYNYDAQSIDDAFSTIRFYAMDDDAFVEKVSYTYNSNIALLTGKFRPNDDDGVLVVELYNGSAGKIDYIHCENDVVLRNTVAETFEINCEDAVYISVDMSGDGVNELMALYDGGYKVFKLGQTTNYRFILFAQDVFLTKDIYPFPNDFNGDGKTDILYYHSSYFWRMAYSTGKGFELPVPCANDNMLRHVRLEPKDRYKCSLREIETPSVVIRTADFDGDGTADVGVFKNLAGNHYLELGLKPCIGVNDKCTFTKEKRYYMPINYTHQTIHIGRFLPQENVTVLSSLPRNPMSSQKANIVSLYPHSSYYGVERIIDGLGNVRGFSYDYLMSKNGSGDFYTCSQDMMDGDVRKASIPVVALKTDTVFNVNDKPVVTKYTYNNALVHTKGHGFLGFENVVRTYCVNSDVFKKYVCDFELLSQEYPILVPKKTSVYYGEKQLLSEKKMFFEMYRCVLNNKVVKPLMTRDCELMYSLDEPDKLLKNTMVLNKYESDEKSSRSYKHIVQLINVKKGSDDKSNIDEPDACLYISETSTVYDDIVSDWVVNRPKEVCAYCRAKQSDKIGTLRRFSYDDENPMLVVKDFLLPNVNGDCSDPLQICVEYDYDKFGNVIGKTRSSPSVKNKKSVRFEYDAKYNHRYVTKTIDELGREIECDYDNDYGICVSTSDFNGFKTLYEKDFLGIDDIVVMPDGTRSVMAKRWSWGNDYAPDGASYYKWEKKTGNAEIMTFYHKSGLELRNVTFDMKGRAVFVDKIYDDYGNVIKETMPYFHDDSMRIIVNDYDSYNRLIKTTYPNTLVKRIRYDGNIIATDMVSQDGKTKSRVENFNIMGLLNSIEESGGTKINYEYYSDGKIKSMQLADDVRTNISVTYDNNGNRKSLYDPNCGIMMYEYDAFGNIVKIINPHKSEIEFQYDALGRMIAKKERDYVLNKESYTNWIYDDTKNKNGLLNKVVTSENHQIDYVYDDNLMLVEKIETVGEKRYVTKYAYDEAGRKVEIKYPSGVSTIKVYSNSGYEKEIYDGEDHVLLWSAVDTDACAFVTDYSLGNGLRTNVTYNKSNLVENISTSIDNVVVQDMSYGYDGFGNVTYRTNKPHGRMNERFEYDDFDRMVRVDLNAEESTVMCYDKLGNIIEKEVENVRTLYQTRYDQDRINAMVGAKTDDEKLFQVMTQDVLYSAYGEVVGVAVEDRMLEIHYGYDRNRIMTRTYIDGKERTKVYVGDCEFLKENGRENSVTYLQGPNGVFAVCSVDEDGKKSYNYVHKDHLGSWSVITDENCRILQEYNYDAWGNVRNPDTWKIENGCVNLLYDRGYSGHEHHSAFGLINMNGRMYDPKMSMMLSPDNNIQFPQMSQNFNRYSYCLNNPLKYKDPTGESIESIAFGIIGGASNVLFNYDDIDTFGEAALLFGVGFAKGFLTEYTMGQSWLLQLGVGTVMSGVTSGVNQMVSIGDGTFKFSGDDWNSIGRSAHYGLGSGLVKSLMYSYITEPTAEQCGDRFIDFYGNKELAHALTAMTAHGVGCWFSGQPVFESMSLKDVGVDMKMFGLIANRLLSMYVTNSDFAENAIKQRGEEIKMSLLNEIMVEMPEYSDLEYTYELLGAFFDDSRLYIMGNVFAFIPGEIIEYYPKPYIGELITLPFNYSLFKTLFFNKQ